VSLLLDEIRRAAARLAEADVESPRADAEQLAAHVHGVRRAELPVVPDEAFDTRFWDAVNRRVAREPLQHITGVAYFRHLELTIGPGVFTPRPETEVMTGWAIGALREMGQAGPVVADLGTGSGAIALSIAVEAPHARVYAVEADPLAAPYAERNVAGHAARGAKVSLVSGDFATALAGLDGTVDLVISNPPYIPLGASVPPEVGDYDPPSALWSGADGLDAIRSVRRVAARLLHPGGLVAVEHGAPQGGAVRDVFAAAGGWADITQHQDLAGRDRFVTAVRRWQDGQRVLSGSRGVPTIPPGCCGPDLVDRPREPRANPGVPPVPPRGPALTARS
jgi:release factor glutamine methyltransferase